MAHKIYKGKHFIISDYQKGRKKELFPHTKQIDLTATRAQGTDQLNTAPTSEKNKWNFVYKTPLESEIDDLKDQTNKISRITKCR